MNGMAWARVRVAVVVALVVAGCGGDDPAPPRSDVEQDSRGDVAPDGADLDSSNGSDTSEADSAGTDTGPSDADDMEIKPSDVQASDTSQLLPPAIPGGLNLIARTHTSLTIGWGAVPDASDYVVRVNDDASFRVTGTWLQHSDLQPLTTYVFTVVACNSNDICSNYSTPFPATTDAPPGTALPNDPPNARGDTVFGTRGSALVIADPRGNDSDPDGDPLTLTIVRSVAFGTLVAEDDGAFTYTPGPGFHGLDSFDYHIQDGRGGEDTATVRIHIANRTFYVAPNGNDSNNGLAPTSAWRTPGRVGSAHGELEPGDVVLFQRGGTYRGGFSLHRHGTAERPVVIGAWGDGPRPVISGSREVTGWTRVSGDLWWAAFVPPTGRTVKYLFVNGARQPLARFPNEGWLRTDGGSANHLIDNDLTAPAGTYTGARVVIHAVNWAFETATVASHPSPTRLNYANTLTYYVPPGDWGYFIENKRELIDSAGEWHFDATANRIYLQVAPGTTPADLLVEAAVEQYGVLLQGNHQVVDGIESRHFEEAISVFHLNSNVLVRDCVARDSYWGIRTSGNHITFHENHVHDTYDSGMFLLGTGNVATRNRLERLAVVPGLGRDVWGYMGVTLLGQDSVLRHNHVESVGYIAIEVSGARQLVEENVVHRSNLVLNDGGGIAFDNLDGTVFRRNIVTDAIGFPPSMSRTQTVNERLGFNMYFGDKNIRNTRVEGNILGNAVTGIHIDHTTRSAGNVITGNLIHDHRHGVTFSDYSNSNTNPTNQNCVEQYDDVFTHNVIMAGRAGQYALHLLETHCVPWIRWGSFNHNQYLNPFGPTVVHRNDFMSPRYEYAPGLFGGRQEYFTLAEWKAEPVGLDADSSGFELAWTAPAGDEAPTKLFVNPFRGTRRVPLTGTWVDHEGAEYTDMLTLPPYSGAILLRR